MAKRIQVSSDDTTYYTLPGNSGELRNEAGDLTDTIFGQSFESGETGLITGTINSNALYKGFAGYIVSLKKSGATTPMVAGATTQVGTSKTYQISDITKQILDADVAVVVKDNGVAVTDDKIESIDYMFGKVTFAAAYTPTGPVTLDASYLPMTEIAGAKTFTLTQTAATIDTTDIPTAKANGGFRTFDPGLRTVSLELGGIYKLSNGFKAALAAREPIYVEINPDANNLSSCRGVFKYMSQGQSGDVGALEEETVSLKLAVPEAELLLTPFAWSHASASKLSPAVQAILNAWQDETQIYVKYLPDGSTGMKSSAVMTDVSLAGGLDAMNEFTANFQLSGAATTV